jgi:hypothetical protein
MQVIIGIILCLIAIYVIYLTIVFLFTIVLLIVGIGLLIGGGLSIFNYYHAFRNNVKI